MKPAEWMRPGEIIAAREKLSCALVPVSPCFEWHSYHLPLGTDGLIAERLCELAAERAGGIYFRALSFGLDRLRTEEELASWGLPAGSKVFGMRFPGLPVFSEYCEQSDLERAAHNRLHAIAKSGFKRAVLVNQHGGAGQIPALEKVALEATNAEFKVTFIPTYKLVKTKHAALKVGGHAGLAETIWLMAFCPELIDLTQVPDGELDVNTTGILHNRPRIEAQYNPREALKSIADQLREEVVKALVEIMTKEAD